MGSILRALVLTVVASAALAAAPLRAGAPAAQAGDPAAAGPTREIELVAAVTRVELLPGVRTEVWAYNGQFPGPVLEFREGDRVRVRFRNDLPEATTVHWHGMHLPFASDGSPFHPVAPGEEYEYAFTVQPGTAGTYWYHPHPDHRTGHQVARGLHGGIVVRAADDPLPAMTERLLVLSDNRFLDDGSFDLPDPHSHQGRVDFENGREGSVLFVNGEVMPTLSIRSGEVQRWRVVNASAGRFYRLSIPGHRLLHVGSDGGLFERPVEVDELLLATAERVEFLVRGTGAPGAEVVVQTLPYDRYIPQTRPADWDRPRDLLVLRYEDAPPAVQVDLPTVLRPVPALDPAQATATRVMVMSQGFINGLQMDMARVDVSAPLGATEIWQVENVVGMDHPFHLHGFQFQVLDRDGVPEPFPSWKDTVNVPRHQTVRFIVRYDNFPGMWMFHCHILDHEDHGMMGVLEVR
jgi:FtsP/CotA-like multicopper oxidase with cupredoxin domain